VRASFLCGLEKEKRWAACKRITAFQEANKYGTLGSTLPAFREKLPFLYDLFVIPGEHNNVYARHFYKLNGFELDEDF